MMGGARFLKQRKSSASWYFYRAVPRDLREKVGKHHWETSLRTSDKRQAEALARKRWNETEAEIERLRAPDPMEAANATLHALPASERAEVESAGGIAGLHKELAKNLLQHRYLAHAASALAELDDERSYSRAELEFERMEGAERLAGLDTLRQVIEAKRRLLEKLGIKVAEAHQLARANDPSLNDLLAHWAKEASAPEQTVRGYAYAVRRFNELHGDLGVSEINKGHLRDFVAAIEQLPTSTRDDLRRASIKEAIAIAERERLPRIGRNTRDKHMGAIRALVSYAVSQGHIETNSLQGFKLVKPNRKATGEAPRLPFDEAELKALFAAVGREHTKDDADFWIPRLAIYAGLRLEETCQLLKSDIKTFEGVLYFSINAEGDKKLKTASSRRIVPVHRALIEEGFSAFWSSAPGPRVFDLKPDRRGRLGGPYGKRFALLLHKKAGIVDTRT